ncbi:MAG: DNA sulfur modification protein DndD [Lachnospiraceae bacterium]|nr:DNA sulfur modification protein DndD [Lachnospiraceae bacterium]
MIIKKLILHNFGVYSSTNTFQFNGRKPVVLIGGLNGRGKTTFLEAVLLALYGSNSFAYIESKEKTYGQYLKSYVNSKDGSFQTYVELEFSMDRFDREQYIIRRSWDGTKQRISEVITVYKNGEENQFLTDNWAMFIENILPSGLSNFFFFDGEKIAELAAEKTSEQMKDSIKSLLGVSVLDVLQSDVGKLISQISKNATNSKEVDEIESLRKKRDTLAELLQNIDHKISGLEEETNELKKQLEQLNIDYNVKGGDIVLQRQELLQKRNILNTKLVQGEEMLITDAASELPLYLVKNLMMNIREKAEIEHDYKNNQTAIVKMKKVFEKYQIEKETAGESIADFISYFEDQVKKCGDRRIDFPDNSLYQLQNLLDDRLLRTKLEVISHQEQRVKNQEEANQLERYLSVDIDEKAISKIFKKIKQCEQSIIEKEVLLDRLQEDKKAINGEYISVNVEFNKKVENYLRKIEINDDSERVLKYSHMVNTIIEEYRIRLQKSKIQSVADTMTECYKKLANKKNLIERIEMDYISLDIKYLNKYNEEVSKTSLSAGEKQLMVISMLWALAICSKKKLPVIIDTPLSRLDSAHRESLIKTYFPQASDQTIILSTDSEIDAKYYSLMKADIDDEFTLVYDDNKKCTTVRRGYFEEAV